MSNEKQALYDELGTFIDHWKGKGGALMPVMQKAQEIFGALTEEVQEFISKKMDVPVTTIYGVATFYAQFTLLPKGKHVIGLCLGTACYVKGSQSVFEELEKQLCIKGGQTTPDGLFTLEATRCIGCCGLAPAMMIGSEVYGRLVPSDIPAIIEKYRQMG
jgi:NADH:ubiquinone oxidoreductase subunit E